MCIYCFPRLVSHAILWNKCMRASFYFFIISSPYNFFFPLNDSSFSSSLSSIFVFTLFYITQHRFLSLSLDLLEIRSCFLFLMFFDSEHNPVCNNMFTVLDKSWIDSIFGKFHARDILDAFCSNYSYVFHVCMAKVCAFSNPTHCWFT